MLVDAVTVAHQETQLAFPVLVHRCASLHCLRHSPASPSVHGSACTTAFFRFCGRWMRSAAFPSCAGQSTTLCCSPRHLCSNFSSASSCSSTHPWGNALGQLAAGHPQPVHSSATRRHLATLPHHSGATSSILLCNWLRKGGAGGGGAGHCRQGVSHSVL